MRRVSALVVPAIIGGILLAGSVLILIATGSEPKPRNIRAAAILKTIDVNMEFWEVVKTGMREAAKEAGMALDIYGPWAESDVDGQIRIMEDVIDSKPDVIILSSTDYNALVPSVDRARATDIPVITVDSNVNSGYPRSFVATNNVEAGRKAGEEMLRRLKRGTSVAVINHIKGATTAMEREEGAVEAITRDGRFPLLGVYYTNNFEQNAYEHAKRLMAEHPDLGGIVALNEVSTVGAARAIIEMAAKDRVVLVGFDNSILEVSLVERGVIDATVIQQPFKMGYLAVRAAKDALDGKPVDKIIDTGSILITSETIYLPENQKLVFPFTDAPALQAPIP